MTKGCSDVFSKEIILKMKEVALHLKQIEDEVDNELKKQIRFDLEKELSGLSPEVLEAAVDNEFDALI